MFIGRSSEEEGHLIVGCACVRARVDPHPPSVSVQGARSVTWAGRGEGGHTDILERRRPGSSRALWPCRDLLAPV